MILILNCGSQSIKWKLFANNLELEKEGRRAVSNPKEYQKILRKELTKLYNYKKNIQIVGHRIVHGGKKFRKAVKINNKVLRELKKFDGLAPLHNPFNILGIKVARKIFSKIHHIAVFDTEFYKDLPERAYIYPLAENLRKKYGFRRFGFHGISHEYAAKTGAEKIYPVKSAKGGVPSGQFNGAKKSFRKLKIITCHLGGGSSITAIKNGIAIDTSMGFTPMEGLAMMTRSGDIDPGIILEIIKNFSLKKVNHILNYESGLKGISGSSSMLEILKRIKGGDKKAKLALEIFVYRIQKYIGGYFAILGGCDLLVFTGTIGSGSAKIRNMICKNLNILNKTKILSLKTNEELIIAKKIWIFQKK